MLETKLAGKLREVQHRYDKVQEDAVLYLMPGEQVAERWGMTEG